MRKAPVSGEGESRVDMGTEEKRRLATRILRANLTSSDGSRVFPISQGQRALWLLYRLAPASAAYNIYFAGRLLDVTALGVLRQVFGLLLQRHPCLRSNIKEIGGVPVQIVHARGSLDWSEVVDASELDEAGAQRWLEAEVHRPFELEKDALLRVRVLRLKTGAAVLAVVVHHIVADYWSFGIIMQELAQLVPAAAAARSPQLQPPRGSYAEYTVWQRKMLASDAGARLSAFWARTLAGELPVLELPTDWPRPAVQSFQGGLESFWLSAPASQQVRVLAREASTTPFVVLLACYQVFLARYTGQNDILVGSPVAGRSEEAFSDVVGYFVNMVVLRSEIRGQLTFRELVAALRERVLEALDHQDYPLASLVELLQPVRDLRRSPLFQAAFALQKAQLGGQGALRFAERGGTGQLSLGGIQLEAFHVPHRRAQFDLTLMFEEVDDAFFGFFEYAADLFSAATVGRMKRHFLTLTTGLLARPDVALGRVRMLEDEERREVLADCSGTEQPELPDTLASAFRRQAESTPRACALCFRNEELSYAELLARARRLAEELAARGVGPGDRVGVYLERSTALVVGLLGILEAGAAYVPLDTALPLERLGVVLNHAKLKAIVTVSELSERLPESVPRVFVPSAPTATARSGNLWPARPAEIAYVIYTSGTTGEPKGVMVSHEAVLNRLLWMRSAYSLSVGERVLQKTPATFDVSVWEFFWPLLVGATLVVAEPGIHKDPELLCDALQQHDISTVHFVPSMLQELLALPDSLHLASRVGPSLRRVFCSGEALEAPLAQRFFERLPGVELHNLYGPTEAAIEVSFHRCLPDQALVPIGRPIANVQLYVLDSELEPVAPGVAGDLFIGGVCLARGYFDRPDLTAEAFLPDPLSGRPGQRLYRTGDRARFLPNGELLFLGRLDHQVKVRGFRIELGEVSAVLARHPDLAQVVVVADGLGGGRRLVAYFVPRAEAPTASALRDFAALSLPDYMVPSVFVALTKLPLSPSGKLDRKALPKPAVSSEREYVQPNTDTELQLAAIWSELLGVERVGRHDDFFALGGHSLLAARLAARIAGAFAVSLPLRSVFEQPTLQHVAQLIATAKQTSTSLLSPIPLADRSAPLPLSFAQERLWFLHQMSPESPFYNMPFALRVRGTLDPEAFERALLEVVRRHEALRTRFVTRDGHPTQVIEEHGRVSLVRHDYRHLAQYAAEEEARACALAVARQPFDLEQSALLRVVLLRITEQESSVVFVLHHIVSDGWSMGVLAAELGQAYALVLGRSDRALPVLPLQYPDFAAWQRRELAGSALNAHRAYWKSQLAGQWSPLRLPFDRPRPAQPSTRGARLPVELSPATTRALNALVRSQHATLFMGLFGAFASFLARVSGSDDVRIGTPVANRNRTSLEQLIGFFVNALVLRLRLSDHGNGDPSFVQLLEAAREVTLDAYAHQDLPFEALVDTLEPQRDTRTSPLFQVALVLQNAPLPALELPDVRFEVADIDNGTTKFDLTLCLLEHEERLSGYVEYSADLFERGSVQRLFAQFSAWLDALLAAPRKPLSKIGVHGVDGVGSELLGARLADAPPASAEATAIRGGLIHEHFEARARETPDATALTFGSEQVSYRELERRANVLAAELCERVSVRSLVALCAEPSPAMIVGILAILKAGAAYLPLDPMYPAARLAELVADAEPSLILVQPGLESQLPAGAPLLPMADREVSHEAPRVARKVSEQDLAYVIYTSGSTGRPKGVMVSHANVVRLFTSTQDDFGLGPRDVLTLFHSFAFDFSVWEIWCALLCGGRLVIVPYEVTRSPAEVVELVRSQGVTVLNQTPSAFMQFARAESACPERLNRLRLLIFGGEALDLGSLRPFFERYGDERPALVNMYGITETTVHVTWRRIRRRDLDVAVSSLIGPPISDLSLYVLDAHQAPVPAGTAGELYVAGPGLARGYLGRPELTAERFVPNAFGREGERLYRTGDSARLGVSGELEYLGRVDQQVKIRGFRIELGEIEAALRAHPHVSDAVCAVSRDATGDARIVGYLVADVAKAKALEDLSSDQVSGWQTLYDDLYDGARAPAEAGLDTVGWKSSFTGDAIPVSAMRAWRDDTVQRILALEPRRVWEIGCGSGMLLLSIAPHVESYFATDFSAAAVQSLSEEVRRQGLAQVTIECRAADDVAAIAPGSVDVVVLNSVIQYFPDLEYLERVLQGALRAVAPGGHIFLGDVRALPLLEAFHYSVGKARGIRERRLLDHAQRAARADEELVIDPRWFAGLPQTLPDIGHAEIWLKRGAEETEMARFRFDAVLSVGPRRSSVAVAQSTSFQALGDLAGLRQWLSAAAAGGADTLQVTGIPNARVAAELRALAGLDAQLPLLSLETLWSLAEEQGFALRLGYAASGDYGAVDALFERPARGVPRPWHWTFDVAPTRTANQPLTARHEARLVPALREQVAKRLPSYMVPSAFVCLDELPLTRNGKVDRSKLPPPAESRPELANPFAAPRTPMEQALADLWSDLLGVRPIGIHDDFFALGGHSLLATQLVSRARSSLGLELPLRALFERPTIAALSELQQSQPLALLRAPSATPLPADSIVPLSYAQERMYFLSRLDQRGAYNISAAVSVSGTLDMPAIEAALHGLVMRHEVLRTVFEDDGGRARARVLSSPALDFDVVGTLPSDDRGALLARVESEAQRSFDLARGPLLRALVVREAPARSTLVLTVHHIAADGWSVGIMLRDVIELYSAARGGRPPQLPPLPIQYRCFAAWQREELSERQLAPLLARWSDKLRGLPPYLDLPLDRPRPRTQSFEGKSIPLELDETSTQQLRELCQRHGITLFMVLLAAYAITLERHTGQAEVAIGTPIANRSRSEVEPLVGFFVNTLVLRVSVASCATVEELLRHVREVALEAFTLQDVPFERVVEHLNPARDVGRTPLFQAMFVLQNAPLPTVEIPGVTFSALELPSKTAKTDLHLELREVGRGLRGSLEYASALFDETTIRQLGQHFQAVLRALVREPLAHPSALAGEQATALLATPKRRPGADAAATIHGRFAQQAMRTPAALAVRAGARELTYAELERRANALAYRLLQAGVGAEGRVAVALERGPSAIVAVLAVLKAGGTYVPIDLRYPPPRIALILGQAQAGWVLTSPEARERLPAEGPTQLLVDDDSAAPPCPLPRVAPTAVSHLIYTSGSTGEPKGVAVVHASVLARVDWAIATFSRDELEVTLASTSLGFDVSVFEIFTPLLSGATVQMVQDVLDLARDAALRPTLVSSVPTAVAELVRAQRIPSSVKVVTLAGEALRRELVDALYALPHIEKVYNAYGPSEDTTFSTWACIERGAGTIPPIGIPLDGGRAVVVDEQLRPVPPGVPGQLLLGGAGLARGYWNAPELTAERFVPDAFSGDPGARLYCTGDRVRLTPRGELVFLGRLDHQIKIRGFRVELGEVEAALTQHPAVREAAVTAHPGPGGVSLCAHVVLGAGSETVSSADLKTWLRARLPEQFVPALVALLQALPRHTNGKLNRGALSAPDSAQEAQAELVAPRSDVEREVHAIWSELLGRANFGIDDDFFELGGHSLLVMRGHALLRERLGVALGLNELFVAPTIRALAGVVEEQLIGEADDARLQELIADVTAPTATEGNHATTR